MMLTGSRIASKHLVITTGYSGPQSLIVCGVVK